MAAIIHKANDSKWQIATKTDYKTREFAITCRILGSERNWPIYENGTKTKNVNPHYPGENLDWDIFPKRFDTYEQAEIARDELIKTYESLGLLKVTHQEVQAA